jgi:hypothetical protein
MRKWLAGKLFDLAVWLDWDAAKRGSYAVVFADMIIDGELESLPDVAPKSPPKKRGRPLGAKDKKPRNKTNMGRPVGSKNKP